MKSLTIIGSLLIIGLCSSSVIIGFKQINKNPIIRTEECLRTLDDPECIFINRISTDRVFDKFYNDYCSPYLWSLYILICTYSLFICVWGYVSNISCSSYKSSFTIHTASNHLSKDIKQLIFRKQVTYFIIILILETPYALTIVSIKYFTSIGDYGFTLRYKTFYSMASGLYISRGIFLPLIRLTEPHFLNKIKRLFTKSTGDQSLSIKSAE